ncbi:hypothetical protein, partial [Methanosarcina mazei]|uniref:hypothetical protein n=1 Tax=Methanosarcina mazei TaxID=2209 RepID=UPI001F283D3D
KIFKVKNEEARVHFIPTLKDGVFVTLCAPLVISLSLYRLIKSHSFYSLKEVLTGEVKNHKWNVDIAMSHFVDRYSFSC